jgi:hypothetical protein
LQMEASEGVSIVAVGFYSLCDGLHEWRKPWVTSALGRAPPPWPSHGPGCLDDVVSSVAAPERAASVTHRSRALESPGGQWYDWGKWHHEPCRFLGICLHPEGRDADARVGDDMPRCQPDKMWISYNAVRVSHTHKTVIGWYISVSFLFI